MYGMWISRGDDDRDTGRGLDHDRGFDIVRARLDVAGEAIRSAPAVAAASDIRAFAGYRLHDLFGRRPMDTGYRRMDSRHNHRMVHTDRFGSLRIQ